MASAEKEIVGLALARLRAASGVTAIVGQQIWHRAPESASPPYISGFDTSSLRADYSCITGSSVTLEIHVWTEGGIDPLQDARAIAHEIRLALHDAPLALPSNSLITLEYRGDRVFYDQDGLTGHGIVEFRALTQVS